MKKEDEREGGSEEKEKGRKGKGRRREGRRDRRKINYVSGQLRQYS